MFFPGEYRCSDCLDALSRARAVSPLRNRVDHVAPAFSPQSTLFRVLVPGFSLIFLPAIMSKNLVRMVKPRPWNVMPAAAAKNVVFKYDSKCR